MKRMLLAAALVVGSWTVALAQTPQAGCLHQESETPPERARRVEALQAVRLINTVTARPFSPRRYQTWSEIANSGAVGTLRTDGGLLGQLARKIRWGTPEPLPGWNIHFVSSEDAYAFTLRDVRDPCGFSYVSDESGVILEGRAVNPRGGIVPIAPSR
jgi:hypothetical protein